MPTAIYTRTATATSNSDNSITLNSTANLAFNMPIVFSGTAFGGITTGITYYVISILSLTKITISPLPNGPVFSVDTASGTMTATITDDGQQVINYGASTNDGKGDALRNAFIKVDDNFYQIWGAGPVGSNITIDNNIIGVQNTNGNLTLAPNGVGVIEARNAILPWIDSVYDLGGTNNYWRDAYIRSLSVSSAGISGDLSVNGNIIIQGNIIELGNITTDSKIIHLANTAQTPINASESGIVIGANSNIASLLWYSNGSGWNYNSPITIYNSSISIKNTNGVGNNWGFFETSIVSPTGMVWNSNKEFNTDYFNSAPGGYIDISTIKSGNVFADSTSLHIDQNYFEFTLYDGLTNKWRFMPTGNTSFPNYTFPASDGSLGQTFLTDGSGNIYWGAVSNYANANAVSYGESGWSGNIIPSLSNIYSLGNPTNQWKSLYVSNTTIYINNVPISLTSGNVITVNGQPVLSNDSNTSISTTGNIAASEFFGNISSTNVIGTVANAAYATDAGTAWSVEAANISGLATVATTGEYGDLANTPTNLNQFTNGPGYITTATANVISVNGETGVVTVSEYSNAAVADYLNSGSFTGDISTTGNITGGNLYTTGTLTSGPQNITGNINVTGNITVTQGNLYYDQVYDLVVGDPLIYLGANNTGNVYDLGIVVSYNDGTYQHGGWVRDASDGTWKLFGNVVEEPTTVVDFANSIYQPMQAGAITATSGSYSQDLSAAGNVIGANILSVGYISASGNITGNHILGNGSQLTGLATVAFTGDYANLIGVPTNLNQFTNGPGYITTATANVISVNGQTGVVSLTIPTNTSNLINDSGYITTATANVISVNGQGGAVTVVEYSNTAVATYLASGTDTQNITTSGNISGAYLLGNISQSTGGYGNANVVANLTALGSNPVSTTGNITGGNLLTGGLISATGVIRTSDGMTATSNITGGNLLTSGLISATGNVTGSYLFGNISQATGGYGNANVVANLAALSSNPVSSTGNITGGNLLTSGIVSATSDVFAGSGQFRTTATTANIVNSTPTTVNIAGGANIAVNIGNASGVVSLSGNVQGNTNGFVIGYRDIPQVSMIANATINLTDAGKHYYSTSASNLVLTIANNASQAFAIGTAINIINRGTGTMTITRGSGVSLYLAGNTTSADRALSSYGAATIQKVESDTWFIVGVGLT